MSSSMSRSLISYVEPKRQCRRQPPSIVVPLLPSNPFYYDVTSWVCSTNYNTLNRNQRDDRESSVSSDVSSEVSSDASLARDYYRNSSRESVSTVFFYYFRTVFHVVGAFRLSLKILTVNSLS